MAIPDPPAGGSPTRNDPVNFRARGDAFLAWIYAAAPYFNAAVTAVNDALAACQAAVAAALLSVSNASGRASAASASAAAAASSAAAAAASAASIYAAPNTTASSGTPLPVGTGVRVLATQAGKGFAPGQALIITSHSAPSNYMLGIVTGYVGGTLTVDVQSASGNGTRFDWDIAFLGSSPLPGQPGQLLRMDGRRPAWGEPRGAARRLVVGTNLLLYSEDFSNPVWTRAGTGSVTTGQPGAPDGTATMSLLADNDATLDLASWQQGITIANSNATYVGSVYVRPGSAATTTFSLYILNGSGIAVVSASAFIDWGTLSTSDGVLEDVGGGLFRVALPIQNNAVGGVTLVWRLYPVSPTAGLTGATYVWGAMVNVGRSAALYVKTTGATATGAGTRPQNLLLYSEAFSAGVWTGVGTIAVNEGFALGPSGYMTAVLINDTDSDVDEAYRQQTVAIANDRATYTGGLCLHRAQGGANQTTVSLFLTSGTLQLSSITIDWTTMTASGSGTYAMELLGNGWVRVSLTLENNASGNTAAILRIYPATGDAGLVGAVLADQAQLVRGRSLPAYVRTSGSAAGAGHVQLATRSTYHVDSSNGAVALSLPPTAQPDEWVEVVDVGRSASTNAITLLRSGDYICGVDDDRDIDIDGLALRLVKDITKGWVPA